MTGQMNYDKHDNKVIADLLMIMAKAYFVLQTKTLGFHWNVVGSQFIELHHFFEETYNELSESLDQVSERIRALGFWAPQSVAELSHHAIINDIDAVPSALKMIEILMTDYQIVIKELHEILVRISSTTDESTKDLLINHSRNFEKRQWMLRSLLSEK